jgi:hypothetical protein
MTDARELITGVIIAFFGIVGFILSIALTGANTLVMIILIIASIATIFTGIVFAIPPARKKIFKK